MDIRRRVLALLAGLLAVAAADVRGSTLQIQNVGLEGFYPSPPQPTWVQLEFTNDESSPQTVDILLHLRDAFPQPGYPEQIFSVRATVAAGESHHFDLPVFMFDGHHPMLEVVALNPQGHVLARDIRALSGPVRDRLIAVLCSEARVCQQIQNRISFSGSPDQQAEKAKALKFVFVSGPPPVWWAYAFAAKVIVAAPLDSFSQPQLAALEGFLRTGGDLILVESELGNSAKTEFLASYRIAPPSETPKKVGLGTLSRLHDAGKSIGEFSFIWEGDTSARQRLRLATWTREGLPWLRSRLATSFHFPRLLWLLLWTSAYIFLAGFLNFSILRRLGRREWAWFSVPAISILFSAILYGSNVAHRPKNFGVDEVALYTLDDRSPLAAVQLGLRISAPYRATVTPTLPGDLVLFHESPRSQVPYIGESRIGGKGWNTRFGPPWQADLHLLQWSFYDLEFQGVSRLPGTIHRTAPMRLRNDTGHNFGQVIYVDMEKVYFLGAVSAGAEVDLTTARQEPYSKHAGHESWRSVTIDSSGQTATGAHETSNIQNDLEENRQLSQRPFSIVEMIRTWPRNNKPVFSGFTGYFFGLTNDFPIGASLTGRPFVHKHFKVMEVAFYSEP